MSIKKDIVNALNEETAFVKLNEIAALHRWRKSALGEDVDRLEVSFKYISGVKGGWSFPIESRDYDGILDEVERYTREYMEMCAEAMAKNLRNGYR